MPVTFALGYGISFAVMSCLPVHVYLYHWDDIKKAFMGTNKKDIHTRLIMRYRDVAWWWYAGMTARDTPHFRNLPNWRSGSGVGHHPCHYYSRNMAHRDARLGRLYGFRHGSRLHHSRWDGLCRGKFEQQRADRSGGNNFRISSPRKAHCYVDL